MLYKCIKPYHQQDIELASVGDLVFVSGKVLNNISRGVKYSDIYNYPELMDCLVANEDDFEKITNSMHEIFIKKNHDYGNSFEQSLNKFGIIASVVRMGDKMNRIESLVNKEAEVKDESILDTIMDLANYCVMTAMWMKFSNNA